MSSWNWIGLMKAIVTTNLGNEYNSKVTKASKKLQVCQELIAVVKGTCGQQGRNTNEGDFFILNLYFIYRIELYNCNTPKNHK